jgi:GTP pyrophosphokinase
MCQFQCGGISPSEPFSKSAFGGAKDGPISARDEQRLAWLRQLVEWQRDVKDPDEFLSTLKIDLYPEEVYTFTPKGKVVTLPRD